MPQSALGQVSLFGREQPRFDATFSRIARTELEHGAWVELAPGWLDGHAQLFEKLFHETQWRSEERVMYERTVDVPRKYAVMPAGARRPPVIEQMREALSARYATDFSRLSMALYRDGRDSVAWHGDYVARRLPDALVATVSLGAPRRFLLRSSGGGPSIRFSIGMGDLIVMGGTCQRTYQHCVPKVAHADPRISLMYRPVWKEDGEDSDAQE